MGKEIVLSMIVPTYGRHKEVGELLRSIKEAEINIPYEILIVDQNEDDRLSDIMKKYESLPIIHHKVQFKGVSKARNYGVRNTSGGIICMPDDDAEFRKDTVKYALRDLEKTGADCVSGRLVDKATGKNAMVKFGKKRKRLTLDDFENLYIEPAMYFRREFLEKFKYDEGMGLGNLHGAQEGYDLVYRALQDGMCILYDPKVVYYHPSKKSDRTSENAVQRAFYYSCGLGYLCRKHGLRKKFRNRFGKLTLAIPVIAVVRHREFRYFFAQWMGILIGYKYA